MAGQNNQRLEQIRHSLAHLLAAAVRELYPDAKPAIGPAIEHGFYYDFDFGTTAISEKDLAKIEKKMRELLPSWKSFSSKQISEKEARTRFHGNPYKLELIDEIVGKGETLTLYTAGGFDDLCRGGHATHPAQDINSDAFALDRIAGAYWRGDEKNAMLTRIYGLAFETRDELVAFRTKREEAAKRDHRTLGKELDLYTFSDLVGSGLPLFTPRGTIIRSELDRYVWLLREPHGYQRVTIPHITKRDLYERSGHWEKFSDELFRVSSREGREYALKPMNCPHHTQIFARRPHSYREMPQRYAETTMVYRDEQSGELGGLTRVLSITQDDSHVFCRTNQMKDEFFRVWDIIDSFYATFGFSLRVRLSFHDPLKRERYLGSPDVWERAEQTLREIAQERNAEYTEAPGEAAMYGPKLDFMARDSLDRAHQVATIQLDLNLPERFDLVCINESGERERIVMIHCAVMGSLERFMAMLLEHTAGNLPLWLSPVGVKVLPIADAQKQYAEEITKGLKDAGIRAELDGSNETLGKKIRQGKAEKVPYLLVIGEKEVGSKTVTVESRRDGSLGAMTTQDLVVRLTEEIRSRS